jgi:inosine-uridine nucleoside N-ribohydrolase
LEPEAARIVFDSGIPITVVGLDVTHQALIGPAEMERIAAPGRQVRAFTLDLLRYYGSFHEDVYGWGGRVPLHDACAIAEVLPPGVVTARPMSVRIGTHGELTRGRTVCDAWGVTGLPANVHVSLGIDRDRFVTTLLAALAGLGA